MKTPRFWQQRNALSLALSPLCYLYQLGAYFDRTCTKSQRTSLPVISIGNVTAGGAGKTPTTLALIPLLRELGHHPHILTRGYQGAANTAHHVIESDTSSQVGDEALLLAKAAPTWVGANRIASAQVAAQSGASILVCDDAHQHHALQKDLSFLVIDGPYGIGNGLTLPAGPLREPFAAALSRADAIILIGDDAQQLAPKLQLPIFRGHLRPTGDASFLKQDRWLAFAGMGRPEKFYETLRSLGANVVVTRDYPDHYPYSEADAQTLLAESEKLGIKLITTEKDAVKLPPILREKTQILPVSLVFDAPNAVEDFLKQHLALDFYRNQTT